MVLNNLEGLIYHKSQSTNWPYKVTLLLFSLERINNNNKKLFFYVFNVTIIEKIFDVFYSYLWNINVIQNMYTLNLVVV